MINLEFHFQHTSEVLISNSLLIFGNPWQEITWHSLCCHQFLHVPFTQHAAVSWWMCQYCCNEVYCVWLLLFYFKCNILKSCMCKIYIHVLCSHQTAPVSTICPVLSKWTSQTGMKCKMLPIQMCEWTQQTTTIKSFYILWQENLLYFKDMLHNSFYFP
jgi:hypothetical protein